jgi:hypothetical protein
MCAIRNDWFALSNQNRTKVGQTVIRHNTYDRRWQLDKYFSFRTVRCWRSEFLWSDRLLAKILQEKQI